MPEHHLYDCTACVSILLVKLPDRITVLHAYPYPCLDSGEKKLSDSVRDLDFFNSGVSAGGVAETAASHLIAVTLDNGTCELWDWERGVLVCRLEPGKREWDTGGGARVLGISPPGCAGINQGMG